MRPNQSLQPCCNHPLNVGNFSANNKRAPLYPYFPRTKSGPNLFASDPKPKQERPAHVNLGTTHDYAIGRAGPSILSSVAPHAPLRKELWLAINKIIHDDDIAGGRF